MQMDHMRGMTAQAVALATLRAIERGQNNLNLTWQGKLMVLVSRLLPRLADRIAARKVRVLFLDEIAARRAQRATVLTRIQGPRGSLVSPPTESISAR